MRRSMLVLAVLTTNAIPLLAQDSTRAPDSTRAQRLKEITVTAERFPHALLTTPAIVRVITPSQVNAKAAPDLLTLLRETPGIQVDPVVGSGTGISLQGLGADRILVLMDGAPVEGRLANQFDLTRLDPRLFERIEVVEGPQSTLYGSSALGGVINLVSRSPGGRKVEFSSQGGSFGQLDLSTHLSALVGMTSYGLDGSRRHIDVAPGQADNIPGGSDRWDLMGRVLRPLGSGTLNLRGMYGHEEQTYLSGDGAPPANNSNRNNQLDLLAVAALGVSGTTQLRAHASSYDHVLDRTTIATGVLTSEPQQQRVADLEAIHRATIGRTDVVLGARGEHEWIRSSRLTSGEQSNTTGAAYATLQYRLTSAVAVSTGARLTSASHWGSDIAPRLGLTWHGTGGAYAKAGLAHGFRAPAFTEEFSDFLDPSGYFILHGNPNLKPESSWNITTEVGVQGRLASVYLRGYGNRLRNFIEYDMVGAQGQLPIFSYKNVGKARTVGGEVGGSLHRGIATLEASYAYLDARDQITDTPLLGRASQSVRGGLTLAHQRWSLAGEFVRSSRLPLSRNPGSGQIVYEGASPRVNLRAGTSINHVWQVNAGLDNIGNVIPQNALSGFRRRWFAGLTWSSGW